MDELLMLASKLIDKHRESAQLLALSLLAATGRLVLAAEGEPKGWRVYIGDVFLAIIAIMLGTGLITFLRIDPGTMFANGLLVVIGIYARRLIEQVGVLISKVSPALGDKLVSIIKAR